MLRASAAAAALVLVWTAAAPLRAEILEQVLVKVNGDIVTKSEFEQRQVAALRARPEFANSNPTSLDLQRAIGELTPELIVDAVDELLLVQRGRELNYALGNEQFNSILENIKKSNNLTDEAQFQAALKQEGLTLADLRRNLERSMLVSQVQRSEVIERIEVTEEEARAYYNANRSQFITPSEVTLREILIEVPTDARGVNVAADDEAKAEAEAVRKRLLGGEPFPRLAAEFSDAPSRANGGLIGPFKGDELAPQFQEMIEGLRVNDVSEVIRTPRGYQLFKLESRSATRERTFDEARNDITQQVIESKRRSALQKYLDGLREQATITWRNDELKRAYEQGLAQRRQESGTI